MADLLLEIDGEAYEKLDEADRELFVEYRLRASGDDDPPVYRRRELVEGDWQSGHETQGVVKALKVERDRKHKLDKKAKRTERQAAELEGRADETLGRLADERAKLTAVTKERDEYQARVAELLHDKAVRAAADDLGVATVLVEGENNPAYADLLSRTVLDGDSLVLTDDEGNVSLDALGNPLQVDEYVKALRLATYLDPKDPRAKYVRAPQGQGTGSEAGAQGGGAEALRMTGDPLLTTPFNELTDRQKVDLQNKLGKKAYLDYVGRHA